MDFKEYKRELDLIVRQNNIELELYSYIANIIRGCENIKKLALRDVSSMGKQKDYQEYFKCERGFPDFIIADTSFSSADPESIAIKKLYGCIEAKVINIDLDKEINTKEKNKDNKIIPVDKNQFHSELKKFRKLIYTNGIEWRYYELDYYNNTTNYIWSVTLGKYADNAIKWCDDADEKYKKLIKNLNEIKWEIKKMSKAMTIFYEVGDNLYVNLTNKCPCACTFCIRNHADGAYGSEPLWLEHEPSFEEIRAEMDKLDIAKYTEIVFCGYGEPTCRIDTLVKVADELKALPCCPQLRINTNGLGDLVNGRSIAKELCDVMDIVSVSLNAGTKEEYMKVTRPKFENAWEAMQKFTADCVKEKSSEIIMSVVDVIPAEQIEASRKLAESLGAKLRVRAYDE